MAIDILFIIMASFGFYFGYTYGLIRVVIFLVALIIALGIAMYATPSVTILIKQVLSVDQANSALLPFVAFVVTLIGVMLVARIVFKLLEETIKSKQVSQMTQVIGGLMMTAIFIFLYSVLVTFFSAAHVIRPAQADNSIFYKYIRQIPVHSTDLIKFVMPYTKDFVKYMERAFDQLENGVKEDNTLKDLEHTYSDEDKYSLDSLNNSLDSLDLDSVLKEIPIDTSTQLRDTTSNIETRIK